MMCLSDVEGFSFTYSCPKDQKVNFTLNLLHLEAKDWWKLVTSAYSPTEKVAVTWGQFKEMFCTEYVPLVERGRLAHEYLSLK